MAKISQKSRKITIQFGGRTTYFDDLVGRFLAKFLGFWALTTKSPLLLLKNIYLKYIYI